MKSGFEAFGKRVPSNRMERGYRHAQEILGASKKKLAYTIVTKMCQAILKDQPFRVVGAVSGLDKDIAKIDLVGRYRLLSVLLTD